MLNNLVNIFNLIKTRMVKTVLEASDLIVIGTRDQKYGGDYKPTVIKFSDLQAQLNAGEVQSVTDDGSGVVYVDNADPLNPIIEFDGVNVDGVTIIGTGTSTNPLEAILPAVINRGLYTQTNSSTPVTNTTAELSLLDGGLGSLSIPANGFTVGDSFNAVATGHISSTNNHTLRIRVKTGSVVLADTGAIIMAGSTNKHWKLEMNFTVRAIGGSGTAVIVTGGMFNYTKDASNAFEGVNFSTETTTGFDTTVNNTLAVTVQWGTASAGDSIYSEIFTLTKTY